uniref:Uncharacterized protein n=1 Tax=Fagus sylvatica TaxID=28930 RepID=A0A2N9FZV0_FAGSY
MMLAGSNVPPFDVSSSQKNASPKNNSMYGFDVLGLVGYQVSWLEMMSRGMLLAIRADGASVTQCLVRACSRQESSLGTRALSSGLNILSLRCMLSSDVACVFMPSGADSALLDASSCLSSLHAWHAVVRLVVLWSSVRDGMTMKSSMCPTAASLRCVVVVDHVGVLVLSVAEHNVGPLIYPMADGASLLFSDLLVHGTYGESHGRLARSVPQIKTNHNEFAELVP